MILLDTNIVVYLFNGSKNIAEKLNQYSRLEVAISFITLGELLYGAYHSKHIEANLKKVMAFSETVQVLHSNAAITTLYGKLKHETIHKGRFPGDHDLWIAATALQKKMELVTHNIKHFRLIKDLILADVKDWTI